MTGGGAPAVEVPATMRKGEYARHRGVTAAMVSHWVNAGRLVLTADGRVDVAASDRALQESLDPARGGKGGKPNGRRDLSPASVGRAASAAGCSGAGPRRDPPPAGEADLPGAPDDPPDPAGAAATTPSGSFQRARATREEYAARSAELAYRKAAGELVERSDVVRAIADNVAPAVAKLATLGVRIATRIAGEPDSRKVQSIVDAEVDAVRQEIADIAQAFAERAGGTRQ